MFTIKKFFLFLFSLFVFLIIGCSSSPAQQFNSNLITIQAKTYNATLAFSQYIGKLLYSNEPINQEDIEVTYNTLVSDFKTAKDEIQAVTIPENINEGNSYKEAIIKFFNFEETTIINGYLLNLKNIINDQISKEEKQMKIQQLLDEMANTEQQQLDELKRIRDDFIKSNENNNK